MSSSLVDAEVGRRVITRFGVCTAGLNLLLDEGQSAEYLPQARVFPIPRVSRRLRGAAQVRGHPVLVFCADLAPPEKLPLVQTCPIVLLTGHEPAVALMVVRPPVLLERAEATTAEPPASGFASALGRAWRVRSLMADGPAVLDPELWWDTDLQNFFEALARE